MRIKRLTFRNGASSTSPKLSLTPGRATIFIGPNNGGKSRALSEIQNCVAPVSSLPLKVLDSAEVESITSEEFQEKLSRIRVPKVLTDNPDPNVVSVLGRGGRHEVASAYLQSGLLSDGDPSARQYAAKNFLQNFVLNLTGTDRLGVANPQPAEPVGSKAISTISNLLSDDVARLALSELVLRAFGQYLVIDPTQMTQLRYMLSPVCPPKDIERHLTKEAVEFFTESEPLGEASDGTRAFVGIAAEIIAGDPDVIFIDEPEAFLHPSLAFMLAGFIVNHISASRVRTR